MNIILKMHIKYVNFVTLLEIIGVHIKCFFLGKDPITEFKKIIKEIDEQIRLLEKK